MVNLFQASQRYPKQKITLKMFDNLFQEISKTIQLDTNDKILCKQFFETVSVNRNAIIEDQEKIPTFLYFINVGFMRLFYYDENGDEITTYLSSPNGFIASFLSLINQNLQQKMLNVLLIVNY